ncbi:unnamed protein product, partial [Pleuronectes platessa]
GKEEIAHRSRGSAPRPAHSLRDTRPELLHVKELVTDSPAAQWKQSDTSCEGRSCSVRLGFSSYQSANGERDGRCALCESWFPICLTLQGRRVQQILSRLAHEPGSSVCFEPPRRQSHNEATRGCRLSNNAVPHTEPDRKPSEECVAASTMHPHKRKEKSDVMPLHQSNSRGNNHKFPGLAGSYSQKS